MPCDAACKAAHQFCAKLCPAWQVQKCPLPKCALANYAPTLRVNVRQQADAASKLIHASRALAHQAVRMHGGDGGWLSRVVGVLHTVAHVFARVTHTTPTTDEHPRHRSPKPPFAHAACTDGQKTYEEEGKEAEEAGRKEQRRSGWDKHCSRSCEVRNNTSLPPSPRAHNKTHRWL